MYNNSTWDFYTQNPAISCISGVLKHFNNGHAVPVCSSSFSTTGNGSGAHRRSPSKQPVICCQWIQTKLLYSLYARLSHTLACVPHNATVSMCNATPCVALTYRIRWAGSMTTRACMKFNMFNLPVHSTTVEQDNFRKHVLRQLTDFRTCNHIINIVSSQYSRSPETFNSHLEYERFDPWYG